MGTPDFSVPSLNALVRSKHKVSAVVTTADKERGRGQKITFTPVKQCAIENSIPLLQPEKLKDEKFISELKSYQADLFVVVAFRILPREVFSIPSKGSFNLHGSLLPKYRGAAPIQRALINGETETGLTTFMLADKVDTGNILLQKKIVIHSGDNFESLHDRMSIKGAELVLQTVDKIEAGNYELIKQDDSLASPAPKITKEICLIDWNKSAEEIHNLVRGLSPHPAAYFIHNSKVVKIYKSEIVTNLSLKPSEFHQTKTELYIGCGKDTLRILEIQQEGKKRMSVEEFLRGFRP